MFERMIDLSLKARHSCFLWGVRQSGKSTLLRSLFPDSLMYDLLSAREFRRLAARPGLIVEECLAKRRQKESNDFPVIIDEVQKLPELLDEVHSLISRHGLRFILCGSSPRKLIRGGGNLLGGRALRKELFPLTSAEVKGFDLDRALNHGLLPPHYLEDCPRPLLEAYVGQYLTEEILAESLTRNLPLFQRFLEVAALSNGNVVNFANIAREIGMSAPGVRGYFDILTDTLVGIWVPAWRKRIKRRVVQAPRFFLVDVGLVNELTGRGPLKGGSTDYGAAFEHFLFMELRACSGYSKKQFPISYWRTTSGFEVDFILGNGEVALEIKSTDNPTRSDLKGLIAWGEEHPKCRRLLVCRVARPRRTSESVEILPWQDFLELLWAGKIL